MNEAEFDVLLRDGLAPPSGPADRAFVARVDRVVAEAERYRLWRARVVRQLLTEGAAVGAVAASLGFILQIPEIGAAFVRAPGLVWPALLALLLLWMLVRGRTGLLA